MRKFSSLSLFSRLYIIIAVAMVFSGSLSFYVIDKMHVQGAIDDYVTFTDGIYADLVEEGKFNPTAALSEFSRDINKVENHLISWKVIFEDGPPCDVCEWVASSGDVPVYRNTDNQWFSVYELPAGNAWLVIFETNVFNFSELEKAAEEEGFFSQLSFHDLEELTQLLIIFVTIAIAIYWPVRTIRLQIENLIKTQRQFGAGDLSARACDSYSKPIDELATSFNTMANEISDTLNENQVFAQAVPHEARTPLSRIQLAVGLLSQNNNNPQQVALLDNIDTYISDVNLLINQVVAFSKLNSANDESELSLYRTIKLSTFIESRIRATNCDNKLILVKHLDDTLRINTNPAYLRLIVDNLLKNAATHAKKQLIVTLAKTNNKITFSVEDDGDGVPAEHAEKIFIPFYRVDASRSRNTGGLGLGLAIVKAASKRIGANLSLENGAGLGAKFICSFNH